jgi:hypothetical protein
MSYLCYLCLFAYRGVHHILCCVFCFVCLRLVYPMLQVSLDCPFLFIPSVFANVYLCKHRPHRGSQGIGVKSVCSFTV